MDTNKTNPLITIITVVYNGDDYIENTILSVMSQTYGNVEYIIIDGGSKDGTIDIIRKYEHAIDLWISEPDKGIYDAMNKGIALATGDWINFMNAGDTFYGSEVLEKIFSGFSHPAGRMIYGNVEVVYPDFRIIRKAGLPENLSKGMQFSHQSLFAPLAFHKNNLFETGFKTAADFNFIFTANRSGIPFVYADETVSSVTSGGVSDVRRIQSIKEMRRIVIPRDKRLRIRLYYMRLEFLEHVRSFMKKLLPKQMTESIQRMK